jgi:hypothetical protein
MSQTLVFLTSASSFLVPDDCNLFDKIECIGPGGRGGDGNDPSGIKGGGGGSGGDYALKNNYAVSPGSTVDCQVGPDGDTWFIDPTVVLARAGKDATNFTGGLGGTYVSVGDVVHKGGNGRNAIVANPAPGGGAAGPNGDGSAPASANAGGAADNGTVAGGTIGNPGVSGTEFDSSHGCGSGAGRGVNNVFNGLNGGLYGGGASGAVLGSPFTAVRGPGLIVLTYTPIPPPNLDDSIIKQNPDLS